jgi:hypothetical protein
VLTPDYRVWGVALRLKLVGKFNANGFQALDGKDQFRRVLASAYCIAKRARIVLPIFNEFGGIRLALIDVVYDQLKPVLLRYGF